MQNYSRVLKFVHLEYGILPIFCGVDTNTDKDIVCIQINKEISAEEVLSKQNVLFFLRKSLINLEDSAICHYSIFNLFEDYEALKMLKSEQKVQTQNAIS